MSPRSKTFHARAVASLMVAISICQFGRASGSPADIFSSPAPVIGADPPKAAELRAGDASVSTQTGALQYSYPIQVPPGRNGMAPSLSLAYSSQAPIYGGIAVGWSLPLGMIRQDTSHGRIAAGTNDRFMVGESRLVEVTEPHAADVLKTYRVANGDTSFTRYERLNSTSVARWRARATDGSITLFGESSRIGTAPNACTTVDDRFAPITSTKDIFGNEVTYEYESTIEGECRIRQIRWGQNAGAGLPDSFAQVVFNWTAGTLCASAPESHVGSQHDYRTGRLIVTGASKLMTVVATAYAPGSPGSPVHTRTITLGYDPDESQCGQKGHASARFLTSIQESAVGTDSPLVTLPAVTFEYGDPTINLGTQSGTGDPPWNDALIPIVAQQKQNVSWGLRRNDDRWPTVEAMLLDIDGDGLLDRVYNTSTPDSNGQCSATWERNLGPQSNGLMQQFVAPAPMTANIPLPRLKWRGAVDPYPAGGASTADTLETHLPKEGCALNGQVTAFENAIDGSFCRSGNACAVGSDPENSTLYCAPGGTECPSSPTGLPVPYRTYLAYRWLDMDGDGLVDLVAAVHGNMNRYDIERGNKSGYSGGEPALFGAWPACPAPAVELCKDIDVQCADQALVVPRPIARAFGAR